ncbi:NADAR domain-containing protein [Sinorhizobium meliloti]|uniref:NADAR domain-containing protein n=1 Tax=Rhizobium meliloti TaxID=382 RepID=UPI00398D0CF8
MPNASQVRTYDPSASVVFLKTNERFGGLSNMAPGFPLRVNGVRIRTSEALYQACRFPHMPDVQRKIIDEHSPITAKMRSKPFREDSRPDWDAVRVKIMRWCLRVKLAQNWREFGRLLLATGERPIVEQSRKDDFWGAKVAEDGSLVGMNVLGRLLMELREQLKGDQAENLRFIEPLGIPEFLLFRKPIEAICAEGSASGPAEMEPRQPRPVDPPPPGDLAHPSLFDQPTISKGQMDIETTPPVVPPPSIAPKAIGAKNRKGYSRYRESAHDWLGAVPEHWQIVRSKYLFREVDDRTDMGTETLLSMRQAHGLIPHAKVSTKPVTPEDLKGYKRVLAGQMVLNRMQASNGMFAVAREDGLVSPDYAVFRPLAPIEPDYFVDLFKTNIYRTKFRQESKGLGTGMSGFLRLYSDRFGTIPVPQPPADEQRKIVEFIRSYDLRVRRLIRNKRRLIGLLNEQKQATINQAVTRGLNPDAPMKPTGIEWMPEVPAHWEVVSLKRVCFLHRGYDLPDDKRIDGPYPVVSSAGIIGSHNSFIASGPGVATGRYGSTGKLFYIDEDFWPHNTALFVSRFLGNIPRYVFYLLQTLRYEEHSDKSAVPGIDRKDLHDIRVVRAPQEEQQALVDWIDRELAEVDQTIEKISSEIHFIREYRDRLVADVVTGTLDVRHVDISVPLEEPSVDDAEDLEEELGTDDAEIMEGADADE